MPRRRWRRSDATYGPNGDTSGPDNAMSPYPAAAAAVEAHTGLLSVPLLDNADREARRPGQLVDPPAWTRSRPPLPLRSAGIPVGTLARSYDTPDSLPCAEARVAAVATWNKDRSDPQYRQHLHCDHWEVVIPELIFEATH